MPGVQFMGFNVPRLFSREVLSFTNAFSVVELGGQVLQSASAPIPDWGTRILVGAATPGVATLSKYLWDVIQNTKKINERVFIGNLQKEFPHMDVEVIRKFYTNASSSSGATSAKKEEQQPLISNPPAERQSSHPLAGTEITRSPSTPDMFAIPNSPPREEQAGSITRGQMVGALSTITLSSASPALPGPVFRRGDEEIIINSPADLKPHELAKIVGCSEDMAASILLGNLPVRATFLVDLIVTLIGMSASAAAIYYEGLIPTRYPLLSEFLTAATAYAGTRLLQVAAEKSTFKFFATRENKSTGSDPQPPVGDYVSEQGPIV